VKILLLNDNPVVTKLVTLSAQKTSDELEIVNSVEEIQEATYDLFVLDDTFYSENILDEVKSRVKFNKSLFICSRDAEEVVDFTATLRKPFLPTELVELFATLAKEVNTIDLGSSEVDAEELDEASIDDKVENFEEMNLDELSLDNGELLELGEDDIEEFGDLEMDSGNLNEDEEVAALDEEVNTEELDLNLNSDDLDLDELSINEDEPVGKSVLDKDELQEVQELLEESEEELDEEERSEVNTESLNEGEEVADLENLEAEVNTEELDEEETSDEVDELEELNQEVDLEEKPEEKLELEEEFPAEEPDLETQIESAVLKLSDEDLESELDADTLLDIAVSDIDGLEALNSRDIKLAIGEEVSSGKEEANSEELDKEENNEVDELKEFKQEESNNGVEALKKLLQALSKEDVAASLKGMKISINITLGDN